MFDKNTFTLKESNMIIEALIRIIETQKGFSVMQGLNFCIDSFEDKKKIRNILMNIYNSINDGTYQLNEAFIHSKLLNEVESVLFKNGSDKALDILKSILETRKRRRRFEPKFIQVFIGVAIALAVNAAIVMIFQVEIQEKILDAYSMKGIKDPLSALPAFVKDTSFGIFYLVAWIIFGLAVGYTYTWYYNNKRHVIYKIFNIKSYDDMSIMFEIMQNLYANLEQTNKVFQEMYSLRPYKGLELMFKELEDATNDEEFTYNPIFRKYGFNKDVVLVIRLREIGEFMKSLDGVINFCNNSGDKKFKKFNGVMSFIVVYLPLFLILGFVFSLTMEMSMGFEAITNIKGM